MRAFSVLHDKKSERLQQGSMVQNVHEGVWYKREYGTKCPRGSMVQNVQEKIAENLNFVENGNFLEKVQKQLFALGLM